MSKIMSSLFVNNLTVIDFSYVDAHRGLVGESLIVDVELFGELNQQGMIFDFGHVKKSLKKAIDSNCDHTLWLPLKMESLVKQQQEQATIVSWNTEDKSNYRHESPACALFEIPSEKFDLVVAQSLIEKICLEACPDNVSDIKINLRYEAISSDYYHYSHGLKLHDGDCQRIAHGHRSRIEIFNGTARDVEAEKYWCERLKDGYLGNIEDIVISDESQTTFEYTAPQGRFKLSLPTKQVTLMDRDTTVENIAQFIANESKHIFGRTLVIRAFEGVEKGACARV
jgi:6-pyruvoyl-tetrahydropterin synthase